MKILCLYNNQCAIELFEWIRAKGHEVVLNSEDLDITWCKKQNFDLTVSYTYRFILAKDIIEALHNNVVNIHNSLLPWNRGADPNLWSIIDRTPRGVTLHYINTGLDKGDIIAQRLVLDTDSETLSSSYYNLDTAAKQLFKDVFKFYDYWPEMKKRVLGRGSYHSVKDGDQFKKLITSYDISIKEFREVLKSLNFNEDGNLLRKRDI